MPGAWDEYLKPPKVEARLRECSRRCRASFELQKRNIERVLEAVQPSGVACLGAGVLNDIPYAKLIRDGVQLYLVDWIAGSVDVGIDSSILHVDDVGNPRCIYCDPKIEHPELYCRFYSALEGGGAQVCPGYVAAPGAPPRCESFARSDRPVVCYEDVTGGYASAFARGVDGMLANVRTWKRALGMATALAQSVRRAGRRLSIPDSSVELVTSSMLVSQFDSEPYDYFSRRAARKFGPPSEKDEERLAPALERLREVLLGHQLQCHCEEILRILAPGGVCYMSFEMFHGLAGSRRSFLVQAVPRILDVLRLNFLFNFEHIGAQEAAGRFQADGEPSVVYAWVLEPKEA